MAFQAAYYQKKQHENTFLLKGYDDESMDFSFIMRHFICLRRAV